MIDFQLAYLDPYLLEKIFTKLDTKSYFRMQQTCRGMAEFIRKNCNISVHMRGEKKASYRVEFDRNEPPQLRWLNGSVFDLNASEMEIEAFYGIRIDSIDLPGDTCGQFNQLCDFLRKHRITCEDLAIDINSRSIWTKEECGTILSIVKPLSFQFDSVESNRYEALFKSKTLKQVDLSIHGNDVGAAVPKILCRFSDVFIHTSYCSNPSDTFKIIQQIIGFLYPQPPANLHKFRFTVSAVSFGRLHHGWEEEFRKLDIPIRKTMLGELFLSVPNGFSIKIFRYGSGFFLNSDRITLCYQEGSVGSAI